MTTQIAVKLPDELVTRLDRLVAAGTFDSRSAAVRAGIETIVAAHQRRAVDRAYVEGYERNPESDTEVAEARRLAERAIADEPWERWW